MSHPWARQAVGLALVAVIVFWFGSRKYRFKAEWNRGMAAFKNNDFQTAERSFRKCLRQMPVSAPLRDTLATVLARQGKLDEAEQFYLSATQFEPRNGYAYLHLGFFYALLCKGREEEAIDAFEQAAEFTPETRPLMRDELRLIPLHQHARFRAILANDPENAQS